MAFLKRLLTLSAFCMGMAVPSVHAAWVLDEKSSQLYFMFTKNTHLSTTATFTQLSGSIDDNRNASLTIGLGSLDSGLDKRDSRLRDLFFEVAKFPTAEVNLRIYNRVQKQVEDGGEVSLELGFYLTLNNIRKRMKAEVLVRQNRAGDIELTTIKPVVVMADEFGLKDKVQLLVDIAGVNNISYAVPVTFRLKFVPDEKGSK